MLEEIIIEAIKDRVENCTDAEARELMKEYLEQYRTAAEGENAADVEYWRNELRKIFGVEVPDSDEVAELKKESEEEGHEEKGSSEIETKAEEIINKPNGSTVSFGASCGTRGNSVKICRTTETPK